MDKKTLRIIIFFIILALGWILPPLGLPAAGMKVSAVFLALIYGWSFIGFAWPSMICLVALGFTGYAAPGAILGNAFSHPAVLFTIFVLAFTTYCDQSGLNDYMAKWLMSRRVFLGRPWIFMATVLTGSLVIGFLIDGVPAVFLISGILYSMFQDIGYKRGDSFPAYILAGVCIAGVLTFSCKPWAGQNILGISALEKASNGTAIISNMDVIIVAFPVCIATLLLYTLLVRLVFRPDTGPMANLTAEYLDKISAGMKMGKAEKLSAAALIVFLILMFLPNILPPKTAIADFFGKFSMTAAITMILGALSFIRIEDKPAFDFQACSKGINWNVIWMLAASIPVSAALSWEGAGISAICSSALNDLAGGTVSIGFIIMFLLAMSVMTQLTHNVTIVLVAVPLIWNLSQSTGVSAQGLTMLTFLAAGAAFATPAASTVGALSFANGEWIGVKRAFEAGILGWLGSIACMLCLGIPLVKMIFGI